MGCFFALECILVKWLAFKDKVLSSVSILILAMKCQQGLGYLLNANLGWLYSKPPLSRINVADLIKFLRDAILLWIVAVLIPCHYLVLSIVVFYNLTDSVSVCAFNNSAQNFNILEIVLCSVN